MRPCPCTKRGTECTVPSVPGFVSETVVPAKSSTVNVPERALATTAS